MQQKVDNNVFKTNSGIATSELIAGNANADTAERKKKAVEVTHTRSEVTPEKLWRALVNCNSCM